MRRPCIIGTAGHIDHGKTLLIKMLTGVDTDRLKDEKKRGISIELGFASLTTPSGVRCGVIDVPGHERFVRNMLAGAGGIDIILLVIAADEGVMPQTREHLDIVDLLGAHTGVVALTKVDLVDDDWRDLALEEVGDYLSGTCLAGAPVVPVSAVTGTGKPELLAALDAAVAEADLAPRGRFTRLPIDRVFTMQGFGTIVTGTLWAGSLRVGDRVRIEPGGHETRIKSLEVHNAHVEEVQPGQRVAINLHGIERERIARGDWVVTPDPPPAADLLQGRLRCVPSSPYPVKNRMRIRFHLGASEIIGRITPLEAGEIAPGAEGLVQIRLDRPALAERGDRFVLRSYSPMRTLGGGEVIDVSGTRRRRFRASDLAALRLAEEGDLGDRIRGLVEQAGGRGLRETDLRAKVGHPPAEVAAAVEELARDGRIRRIGRKLLAGAGAVASAGEEILAILREHERTSPLSWGPSKSELKSRLEKKVHPEIVEEWLREKTEAGEIHLREDRVRHGEARLRLSPRHEALRERILADLKRRGFLAPTLRELLEAYRSDRDAEELLAHLVRAGEAVRVPPDLTFHAGTLERMRALLRSHFEKSRELGVAAFKEILGVSRKQAVPLLEWVDRERWTERVGDVRVEGPRLRE